MGSGTATRQTAGMPENPILVFLAAGRIFIGLTALIVPGVVTRALLGPDASRPTVRYLARLVGARDLVLGAVLLRATQTGEGVVPALWAGAACDVLDAKLSFFSRRALTRWGRRLMLGAAVSYAATGAGTAVRRTQAAVATT